MTTTNSVPKRITIVSTEGRVTVYAWHHDHPTSNVNPHLLITLWSYVSSLQQVNIANNSVLASATNPKKYVIDATFARNDCAEGCIES